jgi:hypothetical protein
VGDRLPGGRQVEEDCCQRACLEGKLTGFHIPHVAEPVLTDVAVLQLDVLQPVLLELLAAVSS